MINTPSTTTKPITTSIHHTNPVNVPSTGLGASGGVGGGADVGVVVTAGGGTGVRVTVGFLGTVGVDSVSIICRLGAGAALTTVTALPLSDPNTGFPLLATMVCLGVSV